jgi:hypothetical protein
MAIRSGTLRSSSPASPQPLPSAPWHYGMLEGLRSKARKSAKHMSSTGYHLTPSGSVRTLEGEGLEAAVGRLKGRSDRVALSWVASLDVDPPEFVAVTVRAGVVTPDIHWNYSRLLIRSEDISAQEAASRLLSGTLASYPGAPTLSLQQGGNAYWCTTRVDAKMTAPLDSPSYYFTCNLGNRDRVQNFKSDQPLVGPGLPYFPRASDAIGNVVRGNARPGPA